MTAPARPFVDIATRSRATAATAVRQWTDTLPSVTRILTGGRTRQADVQAVVDELFAMASAIVSSQREITRGSLAVAEAANTAMTNAIGAACRAVSWVPGEKDGGTLGPGTPSR